MRLSILMTVYNEADFIDYAIRSCLPHVDDLVIVEGAYQETIRLNKPARSTDGTCEIIEKYKDDPKVSIIYTNQESDKDQRNVGLEKIKQLNPNGWLLIIDGDEVYTETTLKQIKGLAKLYHPQRIFAAYFQSLTFVNDFSHYTFQEFPRLFRITPKCIFVNDNFMNWESFFGMMEWGRSNIVTKNLNIKYHHYSFLKGKERFETKRNWWMNRGLGPNFDYGWNVDKDGKISDKNHKIYEFDGKHPEIIKDHPLFKEKENA